MTYNKEIREEFAKWTQSEEYQQGVDFIADWFLERTLPRSELKKVLEQNQRIPSNLIDGLPARDNYFYNLAISDLTERFKL